MHPEYTCLSMFAVVRRVGAGRPVTVRPVYQPVAQTHRFHSFAQDGQTYVSVMSFFLDLLLDRYSNRVT